MGVNFFFEKMPNWGGGAEGSLAKDQIFSGFFFFAPFPKVETGSAKLKQEYHKFQWTFQHGLRKTADEEWISAASQNQNQNISRKSRRLKTQLTSAAIQK